MRNRGGEGGTRFQASPNGVSGVRCEAPPRIEGAWEPKALLRDGSRQLNAVAVRRSVVIVDNRTFETRRLRGPRSWWGARSGGSPEVSLEDGGKPRPIRGALTTTRLIEGVSRAGHAARAHRCHQDPAGGARERPAVPRAVRPRGARDLAARSPAHLHAVRRWRRPRHGVHRHAVSGRRDAGRSDPET